MKPTRRKRKPSKRISLAPLEFEKALDALLQTKPPPKEADQEHVRPLEQERANGHKPT